MMKKTLTTLSALGTLAIATPAFAHHGGETGILANIGHWLSSPVHGLLSLTAVAILGAVTFKILRKNTEA